MLKFSLIILFCKTDADFHQIHLYSSWLYILGIQFRFLTSLIHVEHCSIVPLKRLCYTLSWSRHQNVVTLVHLGCKVNIWSSFFTRLWLWYYTSWTISIRTWGSDTHGLSPIVPWPLTFPTIESFEIVLTCLSFRKVEVDLKTTSFCRVIDSFQLNN